MRFSHDQLVSHRSDVCSVATTDMFCMPFAEIESMYQALGVFYERRVEVERIMSRSGCLDEDAVSLVRLPNGFVDLLYST